jgi:hypothetical protein
MGAAQSNQYDIQGWEKVSGIQLPGQSGKTRKMEEKIAEFMNLTRNDNEEDDFNIMISSNSKLLVGQTSTRLHNDLGPAALAEGPRPGAVEENILEEYDSDSYSEASSDEYTVLKNGSTTWTSSIKKTDKEIFAEILEEEISMIVCCSNVPRFKKLVKIFERLQKSRHFQRKINIWIDEAHKCVKLLRRQEFNRILAFTKIARLMLVTASWDPIDKLFKVPRITYEFTHPDVYRSLHECEWIIVEPNTPTEDEDEEEQGPFDMASGAPAYVQQIFAIPSLLERIEQPGKHWLIAGNSRTVTHDLIAAALVERGWNGLVLNGKEKAVRFFKGEAPIDFTEYNKDKLEPKDVLEKLFNEYPQLNDAPFFITGLNCIKEGITFQGHAFMLDGAILPNISSPSDAYQLGCRLNGNLKGLEIYPDYAKPLVITTSRMEQKIKKQENIAIYLPRILYDMSINLPTPFLKRQAARGQVIHDPSGKGYRIFKNFPSFKNYIDLLGRKTNFSEQPNTKPGDLYYPYHIVSVKGTGRGDTAMPRYLTEVMDKGISQSERTVGGTNTGFPCYLDITKPDTLLWVAVIHNTADIRRLCNYADDIYPDESDKYLGMAIDYSIV